MNISHQKLANHYSSRSDAVVQFLLNEKNIKKITW